MDQFDKFDIYFQVVHPYNPSESDELELRTGDYVYISSEAIINSPDGWVEGTSWLTGVSGLFPETYTQRTAESDAWTLHKKIPLNQLTTTEAESSLKKECKPSTNENDICLVTSTVDEPKFSDEELQKLDKEPAIGKLYENVLELKEHIPDPEVSNDINFSKGNLLQKIPNLSHEEKIGQIIRIFRKYVS